MTVFMEKLLQFLGRGFTKNRKVFADNAIIHFKLNKECEVSNEHFLIDKVLTAKLEPRSLKKKSISVATYKLKDHSKSITVCFILTVTIRCILHPLKCHFIS